MPEAIFGNGSEVAIEDDADRLAIPIHAFDLIVADECHRGYTSQELSVWRETLDHFDATQIGLTATPRRSPRWPTSPPGLHRPGGG